MTEARRILRYWLLTAFLERGVDPLAADRRHHQQPPHRVRALTPGEIRAFLGPPGRIVLFPRRPRGGGQPALPGGPARIVAFPPPLRPGLPANPP